jgi:hypothetical protein
MMKAVERAIPKIPKHQHITIRRAVNRGSRRYNADAMVSYVDMATSAVLIADNRTDVTPINDTAAQYVLDVNTPVMAL